MYHTTAIGIMDEAYFCPRQEIIKWVNNLLNLNIQMIEDLGSGAIYCQLLDYGFGQRVPMQKVNWKAKFEYEFIANFKVFQNSMEKLGITRKFDIQKLAKAKYQDNLEAIQWLKRYIQLHGNIPQNYSAEQRRGNSQLYLISQAKKAFKNPIKTNFSLLNSTSYVLNQSVCSVVSKPRASLKPRGFSNKQNQHLQHSKDSKLSEQMNEIKKILMSNDGSDEKIRDINRIVFGEEHPLNQTQSPSNLMEIQMVDSDQELVF